MKLKSNGKKITPPEKDLTWNLKRGERERTNEIFLQHSTDVNRGRCSYFLRPCG